MKPIIWQRPSLITSQSVRGLVTSTTKKAKVGVAGARVYFRDPLSIIKNELGALQKNIRHSLGSANPALNTLTRYYFQGESKHVRPMMILLVSQMINPLVPGWDTRLREAFEREKLSAERVLSRDQSRRVLKPNETGVYDDMEPADILNDPNPSMVDRAKEFLAWFGSQSSNTLPIKSLEESMILPVQRRLAEVVEMIHVATLMHDDVIDTSPSRRGQESAPSLFGNKISILVGDFLLARASVGLSRLECNEAVELVSTSLANLVEGEVLQLKGTTSAASELLSQLSTYLPFLGRLGGNKATIPDHPTPEMFDLYMRKTYLKTASLMAKTTRAAAALAGCGIRQGWEEGELLKDAVYEYGKHVGLAFQLVDDLLDVTASTQSLGKPAAGADLKLGLATAPTLYAWQEHSELGALIARKFKEPGDVEKTLSLIRDSSALEKTRALAESHVQKARQALEPFPESEPKAALDHLAVKLLSRVK